MIKLKRNNFIKDLKQKKKSNEKNEDQIWYKNKMTRYLLILGRLAWISGREEETDVVKALLICYTSPKSPRCAASNATKKISIWSLEEAVNAAKTWLFASTC